MNQPKQPKSDIHGAELTSRGEMSLAAVAKGIAASGKGRWQDGGVDVFGESRGSLLFRQKHDLLFGAIVKQRRNQLYIIKRAQQRQRAKASVFQGSTTAQIICGVLQS